MATKRRLTGFKGLGDETDSEDEGYSMYDDDDDLNQGTAHEAQAWNLFREFPVKKEDGSMASTACIDTSVKIMKMLAYVLVFSVVLGSAVVAKGTMLFITSQLKKDKQIVHCNRVLGLDQQFITVHTLQERITWLWAIFIAFSIPEIGTFLRSLRICFFKTYERPSIKVFVLAFLLETLYTIGIAMLVLLILPELDVVKGAMLLNAVCIIPGILNAMSRDRTNPKYPYIIAIDVFAVSAQATAFVLWPLLTGNNILWVIPAACLLISLGWWENYVGTVGKYVKGLRTLQELRRGLKESRYFTHLILSLWKILVFMCCILISLDIQNDDPVAFFSEIRQAFGDRYYHAHEVQIIQNTEEGLIGFDLTGGVIPVPASWGTALWVVVIQVGAAYVCFAAGKTACKILIQSFSFTFALSLVGPVTINLLIVFCGIRNADPCAFHRTIPDYLFFDIPPVYFLREFIAREMAWVWLLWLLSQSWITLHTWHPTCERLATTDKLFAKPWYSGILIDQSLLMNRCKDEDHDVKYEEFTNADNGSVKSAEKVSNDGDGKQSTSSVTRIFVCATMWHETKDEIMNFLKSIMRMDEDQSARRSARKHWNTYDPDYYEMEANIFMDDAFEMSDHSFDDFQVNRYVKILVDTINDAVSEVHLTNVKLRPPKKYPTPYGGRLEWTLPGKNKLICHLKDKSKIRHRKRWSQVMYMYYLLGHRLMDVPDLSIEAKEIMAENTYLLALDGDIDFKPSAVTLLVDLMKRDKKLGAACGRIHPVGSGFMAWYQMFEYAIGHWLQKATEHMIGCVLCSPGCFSLFRAKALMDDNVMKKYTFLACEARHYVQYDQGEDRWLCTLLLQRGYRVEYAAASDAYTHCPETFAEFYNQRRRWVPSTMANIFDLLADSKRTVQANDNISTLYIIYQSTLMVGSILGPGTIFLMMIGAMNAITQMSNFQALLLNLIPILIYIIVCMTCKSETQLFLANIITCMYAMIMMMVIVGIGLQIAEDGWMAPSSMFTVATFGIFFITAALHPQEIICLLYIPIYYITIPSMYMLLIIYSLCNLNNVTWGTRETPQRKTQKQLELEAKAAEESKKKEGNAILSWLGKSEDETGSIECGISGLFRCICCTNPRDHKNDLHLVEINKSIEKIEKNLTLMGAPPEVALPALRRRQTVDQLTKLAEYTESEISTDIPKEIRDDLVNPYWIEDPDLSKGEVDFLPSTETKFWKDFIDRYLRPIDENPVEKERIKTDLKNLRDTMVFAFVMVNALFVIVIFLLQLNQDQLHFQWPFGQRASISYDDDLNVVTITQDHLTLEPIGSVFLVFFGIVMFIQFTAMIFHRLGTFSQILANVNFSWIFFKKDEDITENGVLDKEALHLAKILQQLKTDDDDVRGNRHDHVTKRNTVHNLAASNTVKQNDFNLEANFKRRVTIMENKSESEVLSRLNALGIRRETIFKLQTRRDSVVARRQSQLQFQNATADYIYNTPDHISLTDLNDPTTSGAYVNRGYLPAMNSDDSDLETPQPRRKTRFLEDYA